MSLGKKVFWHSSAHVLGEAAERHYGCHLCIGPPTDEGFFYEMDTDRPVSNTDYPSLEKVADSAIKDKQKFERLVVSKEKLLEMFSVRPLKMCMPICMLNIDQYNKFKKYIIESKIPDGTSTTVYRCGPMVDLCIGPHIPHTGKIKAFMVTKVCLGSFRFSSTNNLFRTPLRISLEILTMSLFNASMASPSPTRNKW